MEISKLSGSFWSSPAVQQQQPDFSITENLTTTVVQKMTTVSGSQDVIDGILQPWQSASEQLFNSLTDNLVQSMIQTALPANDVAADTSGAAVAVLQPFGQGSIPGFADVLDIINPLQHIPVVNHYYQQWSGDQIGYLPQLIGSTLYGGSLGLVTSAAGIGLTGLLEQSPVSYVSNTLLSDTTDKS